MSKLISFSDSSIVIDNILTKDNMFLVKIHRKGKYCRCPKCGNQTKSVHSIKTKHIQDLPIQNKCVMLEASARLFVCHSCNIKFIEFFETSQSKAQRTDRLDKYILDIAVNNSSLVSAELLNRNGIKIKKTSICKLLKKLKINIDRETPIVVAIDDLAIKKKKKYATIMVNQETHKIIDILPSRTIGDVVNWLSSFKNIKVVTRDGSNLYKQSIINTNSNIVQISDRFHLIMRLSEYLSLELKNINNKRIKVDEMELSFTQKKTVKEKFFTAKQLIEDGYNISNACICNVCCDNFILLRLTIAGNKINTRESSPTCRR